jgi:hypothetical protein
LKLFQAWGERRIKKNEGRDDSTMIYCRYFVNVTMYSQHNNNNNNNNK